MITSVDSFGRPGAWKQFLIRRFIRIAPLYWIITSIFVIITLLIPSQHKIDGDLFSYIIKSYLFIPALRSADDLRPILGQGWSLNYEMFFYIMFAVSMVFSKRLAVIFLTLAFCIFYWEGRQLTISSPILFTWCNGLIFEFLLGVYVGLAFQAGFRVPRLVALGAIFAGFGLLLIGFDGASALIAGVPATLILVGATLGPQFNATNMTHWLVHIGNASYSLYLTHTLFIRPLWSMWAFLGCANWHPGAFVALSLVVTITAALAVYHYIETPLLAALRGLESGASALKARMAS